MQEKTRAKNEHLNLGIDGEIVVLIKIKVILRRSYPVNSRGRKEDRGKTITSKMSERQKEGTTTSNSQFEPFLFKICIINYLTWKCVCF